MKLIKLFLFIVLLASCEKQESETVRVIFYTTRTPVYIYSSFGNFQISQGSNDRPDCDEKDIPNKIKSYHLIPGTYKVKYKVIGMDHQGSGQFTVTGECLRLDCGYIPGWN